MGDAHYNYKGHNLPPNEPAVAEQAEEEVPRVAYQRICETFQVLESGVEVVDEILQMIVETVVEVDWEEVAEVLLLVPLFQSVRAVKAEDRAMVDRNDDMSLRRPSAYHQRWSSGRELSRHLCAFLPERYRCHSPPHTLSPLHSHLGVDWLISGPLALHLTLWWEGEGEEVLCFVAAEKSLAAQLPELEVELY